MQYVARSARDRERVLIEFPDAPGCQTFAEPGEDPVEVAREALEGWLEVQLQDGDVPPEPHARLDSASFVVRIDPQLAARVQLRLARQRLGVSQGELAKKIGVSRQQISQLESPDSNLTLGTLERVASALGLDVELNLVARTTG